jgi:class 3 adenylate cyclase/tetratricopeptide (TPR) repeat protein
MRCAKCDTDNRDAAKFCDKCGAGLAPKCASCGAENRPDAKFCDACGTQLEAPVRDASSKISQDSQIRVAETSVSENLDGERKTVTALFADIKGSTELMADLDPEEARAIIDPALKLMIEAVRRYDGYVVQSTGDGIFALFGAPIAQEDHPQRALYAALRLQEELARYSAKVVAEGSSPIQGRIGINTGEVVVRSIHTGDGQTEYTPIGHTTNLASRMQTAAPVGSVVVSENTRKLCEGYFVLKSLGATKVKGVVEPVHVYEVTGLGPLRTRLQRAAGRGLTKFVGREREMEAMRHAAEQAKAGRGQIVAVMAEPGVGKSRLFYEFKASSQFGWMVLETFSISHGKASAYLPVIDLLRNYFDISTTDDERRRREKVAGRVVTLDRSLEETLPYLFALLGIVEGDDPLAQMDGQIRKRRTLEAIKRILLRESLNQPLMVIFEDLHWIDEHTQELLNLLADSIGTAKVLLLVNYRPEYSHQWNSKTYYTEVHLDPLGNERAEEMLTALVGDGIDVRPLKQLIVERTDGTPFFIEEIVQSLFEDGALHGNGSVKLAKSMNAVKVPPTVQAVIAARIDRLPSEQKDLLQTLAVLGREFPFGLVQCVTLKSDDDLVRMLGKLQIAEFIYEQPAIGDPEYTFKHALTQEVSFNSLLAERRKHLHQRVGQSIEKVFAEHLDDHLSDLAHHYRRSNDSLKAIEYLRRAGEQSSMRAFYDEAIEQLNGALEILQKLEAGKARDAQELAIRTALMAPFVAISSANGSESLRNSERVRELCEQAGDTGSLAIVLVHLFFFHHGTGSLDQAEPFANQALELAEAGLGDLERFCGRFSSGWIATLKGQYPLARLHFERALEIGQETQNSIIANPNLGIAYPNCIGFLMQACWILGYPDQAQRYRDRLVELLAQKLPPLPYAVAMLHLLTMRCFFLRDFQGTRASAQASLDRFTQIGYGYQIVYETIVLGTIMVVEGEGDAAIGRIRAAYDTAETAFDRPPADWIVAGAYVEARRGAEGSAFVEKAIARVTASGRRRFEADLHRMKGEFLVIASALDEAEVAFKSAIAIARRQQAKSFELRAATSLARLLAEQSRHDEARSMLAEIYNWFTEGFDTVDLKDAKALLDQLGR